MYVVHIQYICTFLFFSFSTLCSIADAKPCLSELQKMTYNDEAGKSAHIRLMERIRPHFKQVAIALKFCHHDIDTIEKKDDPVYDLLSKWLEGANQEEDPRPLTWETLITAIRDAGVHEVANILTKYLVQPVVHNDDTCLKGISICIILCALTYFTSCVHVHIQSK